MSEEVRVVYAGPEGSIVFGTLWMLFISLLLFWLPVLGPLIAGIVGGKKAGGVMAGMMAALLPAILVGGGLFFFGSAMTGIPVIGAVFGAGAFILLTIGIGPMLVGAIIGGALA